MKTIPYGHQCIDEKDINEVTKVLRSDWITQGSKIEEFEKSVSQYTGAKYAVAVSSGTAALHIAAIAAGIKKGDEVITTPLTFVASSNCVLYCGGKPVFTDIETQVPNIDPRDVKRKITKKTKALIPVDYSGHPCELDEIYEIAKKENLVVIEDAAHGLGAKFRDTKIGSCKLSDMTILSFHPVKHITTGEGGMVLTNDKEMYDKLIKLRNHGNTKNNLKRNEGPWFYEQQMLGFNYRITDFQCALGLSQLKKLNDFVKKRRKIVETYNKEIKNPNLIKLPVEKKYCKSSWHLYYIQIKSPGKRKQIFEKLRAKNIGCQVHYIPVYLHPYYQDIGYRRGLCPNAEGFYKKVISIPLFPTMKNSEIDYIVETLNKL
ncbi:MAG: UDP-4-amino-4,6-dideoxy-N-acetyl-beta-L-altrosamine transaminase [Thermoplasmatales archaeon]|nr:MAG: UDP-4-amino-4,6-dideoxy-N-acetyl-beta-L-altrosamine transaminase [Thermoplasmatales archaeon]